jgi:hypothetical protein
MNNVWRFKMKMVKSLLLGSATGLVAIAGAQAADLPVKAKPVQYVKICSLYGVGFYYVPGTDMCLKIGGWVRLYTTYGMNGSNTNGPLISEVDTRATNNFTYRVRGYITADARSQTPYGTVRSYFDVGYSFDYAPGFSGNRGFIQWAGFTFGLASSFYDFWSSPAVSYFGGKWLPSEDTGDGGQYVWAYTAQFGNGLSATLAAEAQRQNTVVSTNVAPWTNPIASPANNQNGIQTPDVVGNLRIEQSWGAAQIMGAWHDASGLYYTPTTNSALGHPGNASGWALGAGLKLNAPMIGKGDFFQGEFNYAEGATGYVSLGAGLYENYTGGTGGTYGFGLITDSVYGLLNGAPTSIQLTTAWGVNASYQHNWNSQWQTSVYGFYTDFSYNSTATALLCNSQRVVTGATAGVCGFDFSYWAIGTRTNWHVSKTFYMGLDVAYGHLNTAAGGAVGTVAGSGTQPTAVRSISDQDAWSVYFRVHRDFYP